MKHLLACLAIFAGFNLSAQWNADNDVDQDGCVGVGDVLQILSVFGSCEPVSSCFSPTMDGYNYDVVEIGDQCWFAENLRTTTYLNGDVIPAGLTDGEWTSTTSGATAVYGENGSFCDNFSPAFSACDETQSLQEHGRLYNWYSVNDARDLCPGGWHVPTDGDWTDLKDYITAQGFSGSQGTALKSTYGWHDGGNGTDDFGFSAFPAGRRANDSGHFNNAGKNSRFWSSSPAGKDRSWKYKLNHDVSGLDSSDGPMRGGLSVRCIKNAE